MRDFIKKQIQERMNIASKNNEPEEEVSNEAILEYTSLFQELDDLSLNGSEDGNTRKLGMDIPLVDDDAEIESVEFDVGGGKLKDIPDTAAIQEAYDGMKTFDQFYQEAYEELTRLPRESESGFERRVNEHAQEMYNEYCAEAEACGYFGFDKINITDERVPSKLMVNFGSIAEGSNDNFVTKVNAFFGTDEEHNITKKQLDSVHLVKEGALKNIGKSLKAYMESAYDVDPDTSVWEVCTPKSIIVPKGNADSFCVVVEYTNEVTGKNEYFGWTAPVTNTDNDVTIDSCEKFNMESFINETQYENHDKFIQEQAQATMEERIIQRRRPSRFFQEAIDLGGEGGDAAPAEGGDATTEAPAEGGGDAATTDAPAEGDAAEGTGEKKETAAVNNVSTEIAEKVANDTNNDAEAEDEQVTFEDDEVNPDTNVNEPDAGSIDDTPVEDDITGDESTEGATDEADDMLNDLDTGNDTGTEDTSLDEEPMEGDEGTPDVDNVDDMSVNELLELGSESLKNMKVGDLKELIKNGDENAIQEAFFLTPKNINKEVDIKLRECLGILNDTTIEAPKLLGKFKIKGHKLNRTLSKAVKMTKVYSSDEIASIKKLNTALSQLLLALKKKPENYGSAIKSKIIDFTKAAKVVGAIVEDKLGKTGSTEVMQEGFVQEGLFLSAGNAKKRLGRKITPVYADMASIARSVDNGALTKGKLTKMYKPAKKNRTIGWDAGDQGGLTLSKTQVYDVNTPQSENLHDLQRVLSKIIRKPKVQSAFSGDEMDLISDLMDRIDDFVDMVESLMYENSDNTVLVEKIGELAKKLVDILQKLNDVCNSIGVDSSKVTDPSLDVEKPEVEDSAPVDDDEEEIEIPGDDETIEVLPDEDDDTDENDEEGEDE